MQSVALFTVIHHNAFTLIHTICTTMSFSDHDEKPRYAEYRELHKSASHCITFDHQLLLPAPIEEAETPDISMTAPCEPS